MNVPLHGGQLRAISERFGISVSELLDFSANINPEGPPSAVLTALREGLEDPSLLTSYPDLEETELKRAIAKYAGVNPHNIAVANGFIPLLECALRARNVKRCLLPVPAFVEYRRSLTRAGVSIAPYGLSADTSFPYDFEAMLQGDHDAVLLANPQNPSGVLTPKDDVLEFVALCAGKHITVLLDEAFIDYSPGESLTTSIDRHTNDRHTNDRHTNLIVFRSVTKFHGMPGLRVAYAVAAEPLGRLLHQNLPPWPITTLAARGVAAALMDEAYAVRSRDLNRRRKSLLQDGLRAIDVYSYPAAANYLLLRLPAGIGAERFWERLILDHRIVVRDCSNYEGLAPGHFRVAVRTEVENERLIAAIAEALRGC